MSIAALRTRLAPELIDWFATEIDEGDAPQLHLVGLQTGDLERCLAAIVALAPQWNDRTFHIDDEGVDVTVHERPDVARLVAQGRASHACLGAERITVRPDPRYPATSRRTLGELIARVLGDQSRLDYGGNRAGKSA